MEKIPEQFSEKKKFKFIYRDHSDPADKDKIIFQCEADSGPEADRLYQIATGKDPEKQNYVGCEIIRSKEE